MAEISIIVPVYNVEACLPQCMDSIRRQTFSDIEVVCVVDGSTDRSEMLLRLYERLDSRIRVVVKENGGLSSARNAGLDACTAPIVMFVDSDDMLEDRACQVVRDAFGEHDAELVTFGATCYPEAAGTPWHNMVLSPSDAYYAAFEPAVLFKEQSHPFVWRTAVKRDFLERTGLRFDETVKFGEDQIFHFAAYPQAKGVAFLPDKLYRYRMVRDGSLMDSRMKDDLMKLREHIVISERICEAWRQQGVLDVFGPQLLDWIAGFLFFDCMVAEDDIRADLVPRLRGLIATWFKEADVDAMTSGEAVRGLCRALMSGADDQGIDTARSVFLDSIGYGVDAGRSGLRSKLRRVLPMSALGLEERLDTAALRDEMMRASLADAAAASRSFELLQLELFASGLD